jgi:hypothetical protein
VIDQLQNYLDLVEMTRVPSENPIESREGPRNPELIQIGEATRSDNPKVSTPQADSSGGVSAHPDMERTSARESAPNLLHDLITIYDDEESSKVSLVTPIQITEEKELEKESSPSLNAQIQSLPQGDQEVEIVLDTELLNAPGTQVDSPKDELGSNEK